MKLLYTGATLLFCANQAFAADCWTGAATNANAFEKYDPLLRNQLAWVRSVIAGNCGDFPNKICINEGPYVVTYGGNPPDRLYHVYGASNHIPNQQTWWDVSLEILNQCVWKKEGWGTVSTGGDYNWGWKGTLGYWYVGNAKMKRFEERVPDFGNITLVNGDIMSEGRYIGPNSDGVLIGFDILENGTHVPFDIIIPEVNTTSLAV